MRVLRILPSPLEGEGGSRPWRETDEGYRSESAVATHPSATSPLIRRVPRHLLPQGEKEEREARNN